MKNKLKNHIAYLSGPMDRVSNEEATEWRNMVKESLWNHNIGVLDPCDKPFLDSIEEDNLFRENIYRLKSEGKLEEVAKLMKQICRDDLRMVDKTDFIIVYIDTESHMCGSYHELFEALGQRHPSLIVVKQGRDKAPNWLYGVVPLEFIFSSFEDMLDYLYKIDSGEINDGLKWWRFFDYDKIYGRHRGMDK